MFSTQVNVKDAHFGARMLKRRPPGGGGGMPNGTQMWLFEGVKVDEIGWNFHGTIWTQRQTFSRGIHLPGPPAPWASMQKPCVQVERLLGSVKQQKESNRVTIWQVNKTHWWQSGNLDLDCHLLPLLMTAIWTVFSRYCWVWSGLRSSGVQLPFLTTTECDQVCPRHLSNDDGNSPDLDCLLSHLCDQVTKWRQGEMAGTRFPECRQWVLFTCQIVTLLLSFCCFTEPSNLSTWTQGFCMLVLGAGGSGEWILLENVSLLVRILAWKFQAVSSTFTP